MAKKVSGSEGAKKKTGKRLTGKASPRLNKGGVTDHERHQLISTVAYFRAERRGFIPGSELEDWLAAEEEIGEMLR
jgi:hypothetical protein